MGDDHAATLSSIPNASDYSLMGWGIPVYPSSVEEYEEFGSWGWELSRRPGVWVAFKAISETVVIGRSVEIRPWPVFTDGAVDEIDTDQTHFRISDFLAGAVEERLAGKLETVSAFSRRNSIDRQAVLEEELMRGKVRLGKSAN
ncbi:indolepyruvate oxidoreductase subunit domain protein [Burkholderia pseudomallei MSHR4000]|nr:indolepyruvate oxidoreductase subunit domain protein [Burkholderia pseudomallei MSHR4000]